MKIAIILNRLTFKGGTQRQALELAQELKKIGHDITVYVFEFDKERTYTDLLRGLKVVTPDNYDPHRVEHFWGGFTRPSYLAWWFKRNRTARRLAHLIDPDTDVLNPHAFYVYAVSYYFKKEIKNIPSVWMLNTMTLRTWKFWRAKELNPAFHVSFGKKFFYKVMDWAELKRFISFQRIVVLNTANAGYVRACMRKKATVVRTGADFSSFLYSERSSVAGKDISLLSVGSLFPHRRYEDVIDALSILQKQGLRIFYRIIGDTERIPEYTAMLKEKIKKLGLNDAVTFLGVVSEDDLREWYRKSHVGVFASNLHPGNLATFEMMACGAPVIVSRGASTHELLTDRENAILVDPQKPEDIARAVVELARNGLFYTTLSKNGRRFVEREMSWSSYARSMERVFWEEIEGKALN